MYLKFASLRFAVIILVFSGYGFSQDNKPIELDYSWERLIPLVSKEADVRQLLGEPYLDSGQVKVYRMNSFGFRVLYNGNRESGTQVCDSDQISADTVYEISVMLSSPLPFTKFKIRPETREFEDYERIESDAGTVEYINTKQGFRPHTASHEDFGAEYVRGLMYFPSDSVRNCKCKETTEKAVSDYLTRERKNVYK